MGRFFFYDAFLWLKMGIHKIGQVLISANVYIFIAMMLFLWWKIVKNYQIWIYIGMSGVFSLKPKEFVLDGCKTYYYHCIKKSFCIKDFFSKWDQIYSFLQIQSHFLEKSLTESFISCAMNILIWASPFGSASFAMFMQCILYCQTTNKNRFHRQQSIIFNFLVYDIFLYDQNLKNTH